MTDVIVAGGGPVGLLLACELRLMGAEPLVLEAATGAERRTRSLGMRSLNARSLHSLELRGLVEPMAAAQWALFDEPAPRREPAASDLIGLMVEGLKKGMMRGHFGGLPLIAENGGAEYVMLKQHLVEAVLADRAATLGVPVRHGCEVVDVAQDDSGVTATLAGGERLTAAYLVGCDGGRSLVRKRSGFAFTGTPATMTGRTAVATLAAPVTSSLRGPGGLVTPSLVPGEIATVEFDGGPDDRDAPVTAEELAASVRRVTGEDNEVLSLEAAIRYSDNTRHADTYRRARILLAGDAAHVHSPIGGQGLNLGLQDAVNLGWKLALVARGAAPDTLLDTYTAERHPVAARVLRNTRAQVALMRPGAQVDALREVLAEVMALPDAERYFTRMVEGTDVDYAPDAPDPRVGRFAPALSAAPLQLDGRGLLADLSGGAGVAALEAAVAGHRDRVRVAVAERAGQGGALLVRPDGYVAWAATDGLGGHAGQAVAEGAAEGIAGLAEALAAWFGPPA